MNKINDFVIGHVGAFMLIHLRAKTELNEFKDEFKFIRHAHYDKLIESVQNRFPNSNFKSPILAGYSNGKITTDNFTQKTHCDFVGLMNSQKPLREFFKLLITKYPILEDSEFETKLFQEVILFELSIRNNLCNHYINKGWNHNELTDEKIDLEPAINKLCELNSLNEENKSIIQTARQFRNCLKEQKIKPSYNFKTYSEGLNIFKQAIKVFKQSGICLFND